MNIKIKLNSWKSFIHREMEKEYFKNIIEEIKKEKKIYNILPEEKEIFNAFNITCFNKIKVVIIGQEPYPKKNEAHGLCFSSKDKNKTPRSLKNIFQELYNDMKIKYPKTNNLTNWSKQGVFMLNCVLTVREKQPNSHKKLGWNVFTDKVIKKISDEKKNIVFLLWGEYAKKKEKLINIKKHAILEATHPSPLSFNKGFLGCRHFSKTNSILNKNKKTEINWDPNEI